jgi:putative PIN family toxin of toxin-antitoxin system
MSKPRVVIDTNVVVSALRSKRGAAHKLLMLVDSGKFEFCLSVAVALEYEEVCKRLLGQLPLTEAELDDILDYLCEQADHIMVSYLWRPTLKDPEDDMLLELAVAGGCDSIVTHNRRDFQGADRFGIEIRTPQDVLREIGELP